MNFFDQKTDKIKLLKTILLLIDDKEECFSVTQTLEDYFYNVNIVNATSIDEAVQTCKITEIDLMLFDSDSLNQNDFPKNRLLTLPPIIVIATDEYLESLGSKLFSYYDYVLKPIDEKFLVSKINNFFKIHDSITEKTRVIHDNIIYSETDLKGIITYVSQPFADISGHSKEELLGKPHNIVRHPDMTKELFQEMWDTLKDGKSWTGTVKNRKKNGDFYVTKATVYPRYENGIIVGYAAARQDITEEIQEQKKSQKILDALRSLIVIHEDNKCIDANKTLYFKYNFKDLTDFKSTHTCICDLFVKKEDSALMREMEAGTYWLDYIKSHNDEINLVYMLDTDNILRTYDVHYRGKITDTQEIIVFTDVTELQQQSEKIQEQSKFAAMGEMIAMIAHQWRQPLAGMAALMTKLNLQKKMGLLNDEEWVSSLQKHKDLVNHMTQTIDDFKDFLKNSEAQDEVIVEDIIYRPYRLLEALFKKSHVAFEVNYDNEALKDKKVVTIASELDQVMINLYKNSMDEFLLKEKKDGKIVVRVYDKDEKIVLEICDNAGGIPEKIIAKIFDPYFSTKGKNGTGIGLYMSKTIVQDHLKGSIKVFNKDGGACFTLELPLI